MTDLPAQGLETGLYQGQRHWSVDLAPVSWMIENRLSRHVWFNTVITAVIAVAVTILMIRAETRRYGIWIALMLSYFAVVTGLVEIPNYRYRMVVEPLATLAVASAMVIIVGAWWHTGGKHDSSPIENANG